MGNDVVTAADEFEQRLVRITTIVAEAIVHARKAGMAEDEIAAKVAKAESIVREEFGFTDPMDTLKVMRVYHNTEEKPQCLN